MAWRRFFISCLLFIPAVATARIIGRLSDDENILADDNMDVFPVVEDFGENLTIADEVDPVRSQSVPRFDNFQRDNSMFIGPDAIPENIEDDGNVKNGDANYSTENVVVDKYKSDDAFPDFSDYSVENTRENLVTGVIEAEDFPDFID